MLYKMLSNPIYIGQIRHKGTCHQGQHKAIIDQELWEQVQQHMASKSIEHKTHNTVSFPLSNKLFDISGERLISVQANKKAKRYRYYISQSLRADPKETSSSGWRLPGQEIEQVIAHAASEILLDDNAITEALQEAGIETHQVPSALNKAKKIQPNIDLINKFVRRVELQKSGIRLTLSLAFLTSLEVKDNPIIIIRDIPMKMKRRGIEMRLIINGNGPARVDQTLLKTIVRAHKWFSDLATVRMKNMVEIASKEGVDKSYVSRVVNLAFLAPDIIESIIAGHQPADFNVEKLTKRTDLPLEWAQQHQLLIP